MSVSGISSNVFSLQSLHTQNSIQQAQKEFQQLGKDLQSGNLTAAQSDFTTLQSLLPKSGSIADALSNSDTPLGQAFQQLGQDLKSGNLSGARQEYADVRKDFKERSEHNHHIGDLGSGSGELSQLFSQLGTGLQSGSLTEAEQAYNSITQHLHGAPITTQPVQGTIVPLTPVSVSV